MTNRISWKKKYHDSLLQYNSVVDPRQTIIPKYELLNDDVYTGFLGSWPDKSEFPGYTLYRIRALRDFGDVKAGELGGYIQHYGNLAHGGTSWVGGDAKVCGRAVVFGNGQIDELVEMSCRGAVYGDAKVTCDSIVTGNAKVFGNARIDGWSVITDNAIVSGNAEIVRGWIREDAIITGDTRIEYTHDYHRVSPQCEIKGNTVLCCDEYFDGSVMIDSNNVYEARDEFTGDKKGRLIRKIKNNA